MNTSYLRKRDRYSQRQSVSRQRGSLMLESLIAMLVFALGVLAMFGLQAAAMKHIGEAKFRLDAQFLANELASTIWAAGASAYATKAATMSAGDPTIETASRAAASTAVLNYNCGAACGQSAVLDGWLQRVQATMPGVVLGAVPVAAPDVLVTQAANGSGNQVVITIYWKASDERGKNGPLTTHNYQTTAYVNL